MKVNWQQRLADYSMNTQLAQRWEKQFAYCSANDRSFQLQEKRKGLRVQLSDGSAFFHIESDPAYDQALVGLLELFTELEADKPPRLRLEITTQFLQPASIEFEAAMAKVNTQLLNDAFPGRIGGTLLDVAYLADFMFGQTWIQLNVGAVHAKEVPRRVSAMNLAEIPAVAYFYSIVGKPTEESDISGRGTIALVEQLLGLATLMAQELDS